jgi:type 1 fimbria pilin
MFDMKKVIFTALLTLAAVSAAFSQTDIRRVDFKNFTYGPSCAGETTTSVRVKNGEYVKETKQDGYTDQVDFRVLAVEYGDLTGDGKDEALIRTNCNTGGTGQFSEGFIYTMKAGKPSLLGRIPGGDRADGGLRSLTVDGGLLVVEYNDPDKAAGACCAEGLVIQKYRVGSGGKLSESGAPIKRELYPKERIAFAKGATGKTWTISIKPEDRKRYSLGARAGQTMSMSYTAATDIDLRLLEEDNAQVTQAAHKLDARLKKSGDYTIELSNYGDKPVAVTITIRIK